MKTSLKSLFSLILACSPTFALAQGNSGSVGGGGSSWICRSESGKIWDEAVDLFEAKAKGFEIDENNTEPAEAQVIAAIKRARKISPLYANQLESFINLYQKSSRALNTLAVLNPSSDFNPISKPNPRSCLGKIERSQIIFYSDDENTAFVDEEEMKLLDTETDRAAITLHEGTYKARRFGFKDLSPNIAGRITGCMLASELSFSQLVECRTLMEDSVIDPSIRPFPASGINHLDLSLQGSIGVYKLSEALIEASTATFEIQSSVPFAIDTLDGVLTKNPRDTNGKIISLKKDKTYSLVATVNHSLAFHQIAVHTLPIFGTENAKLHLLNVRILSGSSSAQWKLYFYENKLIDWSNFFH